MTDKRQPVCLLTVRPVIRLGFPVIGLGYSVIGLGLLFFGRAAMAEDWPTVRHDMARSGITSEAVSPPLRECWVFKPRHAPQPAWGDPKPEPTEDILELRRVHFDDVFQPVVAVLPGGEGRVYFGSSADNKVYCLDAATGQVRWTMTTGGPIRLAPTIDGGRVYVGSDDGYAYCLKANDGSIVWKFRAAPEDRRVLGHGKMISLWPLRTGVVVDGGVAYFSAGIFPAEGVFLYAVDAATGREIWRNDSCGEAPQSKISPQGYLLASKSSLYVPMGRVSPAVFDRQTGRLAAESPFFGKTVGGTYALLAGEDMYTGTEEIVGYRSGTRDRFATFPGRQMVVTEDVAYLAGNTELIAMDRKDSKSVRWKVSCYCPDSLILAGDFLFAGGDGRVIAVDVKTGKQVWEAELDAKVKGLAAANGKLLASTESGKIYCFGPKDSPQHGLVSQPVVKEPYAGSASGPMFQQAAERILQETGIRRGYCLVLGVETGQLALELARRSELMIYAVDPDAKKVAAARKALDAAGVYGTRVCVDQRPLDKVGYSDYFANLIVSETAMLSGDVPGDPAETVRMLKPLGGMVMIGQPAQRPEGAKPLRTEKLGKLLGQSGLEGSRIDEREDAQTKTTKVWGITTRGGLPGAGSWTHQYGEPGNTTCGDDQRMKCPLGVLWFGDPGPSDMVNRHRRAAGPLSIDGRMFVQGENTVMAYDAYNGLKLWQRDISGAMRVNASHDSSNLALGHDGLFVAVDDKCLQLDPVTGTTKRIFRVPPAEDATPRRWGYVARDGDLLIGSRAAKMGQSDCLFAFDADSGEQRWIYEGKQIPHNAIAIADDTVFVVSNDVSPQQRQEVLAGQLAKIKELPEPQRLKAEEQLEKADVRLVAALDRDTGKVRWQKPIDLSHCGGWHAAQKKHSAIMATMYNQGVLVFFGVYLDGHYWQQFFAGEFDSRRVMAISGKDGKFLWSREVGFRVRPMIAGDTLYAEPWAFDLHTGEPKTRVNPITGETDRWQFARPGHHCGLPIASPNALFFRSLNLGYYDLKGDFGTMHFGAQRPGCWINFIPAAGLLLMPEASAGCMCAFPNMCSVVFKPAEKNKAWAMYSTPGSLTPVKRLAINFGAPGDRNDAAGNLWLGYPRPYQGRLVLELDVDATFYPGGRFITGGSAYSPITGTDEPWLFASAAGGLRKCSIPLLQKADGTALYRVRLAFADPENDRPGSRVFDVKLQGKTVIENLDVVKEAGGRNRALIRQIDNVEVSDDLVIELVPKAPDAKPHQLPILQGVEIIRQKIVALGCSVPDFLLSSVAPEQSGELRLCNLREERFQGTLQITAPDGFDVSPKQAKLELDAGGRTTIPLSVAVSQGVPAGDYEIIVKLVSAAGSEGRSADGTLELQRIARVEHLGRRGRIVFRTVEDTYADKRYPERNRGTVGRLVLDGGAATMGDNDHALVYLKFRLEIPGKPLTARLRIFNAGNPTGDSGRVCLVSEPWSEKKLTYATRPKAGRELVRLGRVAEHQVVECLLPADVLPGKGAGPPPRQYSELSLVIDPTGCDGVDYISREGGKPAELIVEYEP